jgi:hypothetical protein
MARKKYLYDKIEFDSQEEINFYCWLLEAKDLGFVENWQYQPKGFILSDRVEIELTKKLKTKSKLIKRSLLQPHKYTADFKVQFTKQFYNWFKKDINLKNIALLNNFNEVYIDIKGGFNAYQSHSNFSVERKWVWNKYNIYIDRIMPDKLFKQTWVPEYCRFTPKLKQLRKKYKDYNTFEEMAMKVLNEFNKQGK